jgi:hypothetical protein
MDKLQKIFKGFWRYKERFVLVVLLGFLGFRVYELFVPKVLEAAAPDERGKPAPPQPPPNNPALDAPGEYAGLYRSNAFTYFSDAPTEGGTGLTGKEAGIELLNLKQMPDGRWRAQLKTSVTKKWYDEGEPFEEFKVESINPEEKTVVVYAERFARTVTLRIQP